MCRNVQFTDKYLYFITKKLHRLIQVEIETLIGRIKDGEKHPEHHEEGKVIGVAVADFYVESEDEIWMLYEDSTVEKHNNVDLSMKLLNPDYKIQDERTGRVESTAIAKCGNHIVAALHNGSTRTLVYTLLDAKLNLKHLYMQLLEELGACAHNILMCRKKGFTFVISLRYRNRVDFMIVAKSHLHPIQNSKWIGGGDEGPNHGMVWGREGEEVLIFGEKSIRSAKLQI